VLKRSSLQKNVWLKEFFTIPQPGGCLSATDVKELAEDLVGQLPLPGIEGSPLDPGEIWPAVTLVAVNQTPSGKPAKTTTTLPVTTLSWTGSILSTEIG